MTCNTSAVAVCRSKASPGGVDAVLHHNRLRREILQQRDFRGLSLQHVTLGGAFSQPLLALSRPASASSFRVCAGSLTKRPAWVGRSPRPRASPFAALIGTGVARSCTAEWTTAAPAACATPKCLGRCQDRPGWRLTRLRAQVLNGDRQEAGARALLHTAPARDSPRPPRSAHAGGEPTFA
jgi:hypothetical protein